MRALGATCLLVGLAVVVDVVREAAPTPDGRALILVPALFLTGIISLALSRKDA
jgi:hypothetical protein